MLFQLLYLHSLLCSSLYVFFVWILKKFVITRVILCQHKIYNFWIIYVWMVQRVLCPNYLSCLKTTTVTNVIKWSTLCGKTCSYFLNRFQFVLHKFHNLIRKVLNITFNNNLNVVPEDVKLINTWTIEITLFKHLLQLFFNFMHILSCNCQKKNDMGSKKLITSQRWNWLCRAFEFLLNSTHNYLRTVLNFP